MQLKTLAKIHFLTILLAGLVMHSAESSLAVDYVAWSVVAWLVGYPLYFLCFGPRWE